jgi:hypothetical protein
MPSAKVLSVKVPDAEPRSEELRWSEEMVHVPCSSKSTWRNPDNWALLVMHVDTEARYILGFDGRPLRPGSRIPLASLWPTPEYPKIPVVLEAAVPEHLLRGPARRHQPNTRILWRFDPELKTWSEIARVLTDSGTWAMDLRAIAARLLEESHGPRIFKSLDDVVDRVCCALDEEIKQLRKPDRQRAVPILYDIIFSRLVRQLPRDWRLPDSDR